MRSIVKAFAISAGGIAVGLALLLGIAYGLIVGLTLNEEKL